MGLIQRLSTKIGNLLSGEPSANYHIKENAKPNAEETTEETNLKAEEEVAKTETKKPLPNSVEIRGDIKKSTLALLNSLYMTNSESCKSKHMIVWLDTDKITFNSFSNFEQELENYWMVESGYAFEKVELKRGIPKNEHEQDARKVDVGLDSFVLYLQEQELAGVVEKACVSVYGNNGSLLKEYYELSNEELAREHRSYYNIGRGEFPKMDDGSFRQNHIAIDDTNNLQTNKFVSRAHAHIGYSEIVGFYLMVEYGGSRLSGSRTRILRGEEKIEVENTEKKEPLYDGDLIELGKAVLLKFIVVE